ncbi:diguanylate cyclase [Pokkaliibacter plantistimulans]|uniref:Diguanylate cyclase n=1 Tax=Proteobacteria bacterium 228 TaxID=2083153 RepID=A0A2S5KMM4_9PROT|nr:diguanylate cyclase [Pokkaliibacter plantistimulans]PPC76048.1 diguanylate cyclase [Pokkaliibacter plantistimulans]
MKYVFCPRHALFAPASRYGGLSALVFSFVLVLATTLLSLSLIWLPEGATSIWLADGLAAALLFRTHPARRPWIWVGIALAIAASHLSYTMPLSMTALPVMAHLPAILLLSQLLERLQLDSLTPDEPERIFTVLGLAVVLPPVLSSTLGQVLATTLYPGLQLPEKATWIRWLMGDSYGLMISLPLALSCNTQCLRQLREDRPLANLLILGISTAATYNAAMYFPYPYIFILVPILAAALFLPYFTSLLLNGYTVLLATFIHDFKPLPIAGLQTDSIAALHSLPFFILVIASFVFASYINRLHHDRRIIRENEQRFRGAMNSSAFGMALVSPDGYYIEVNQALCRMLGYSAQELRRIRYQDLTVAQDLPNNVLLDTRLLQGQLSEVHLDKRYIRRDGTAFWCHVATSIVRDEKGEPMYFVAQIHDIDREKRLQLANQHLHERMQLALQAGSMGVWEWRPGSDELIIDARMAALYRLPAEQTTLSREYWEELVHPDDRAKLTRLAYLAASGNTTLDTLFRIKACDGGLRYIRTLAMVLRNGEGQIERLVGLDWDVTESQKMTDALFEEKERLHITLQSIGDAVLCTDNQCRITFMNPAAERLTGWPLAEAAQKDIEEVLVIRDADTLKAMPNPARRCLEEGHESCLNDNSVLINRHGEQLDIHDSAAPVRTRDGQLLGTVLVFQNVTQAREMQRTLRHQASHDALTGLFNRSKFEHELTTLLQDLNDEDAEHVLAFIDLDRFKIVNDSAGHAAGDAFLKQIAGLLGQRIRGSDILARLGGDEFGLLFYNCSLDKARLICEQLIQAIESLRLVWDERAYDVSASIGITSISQGNSNITELMSRADVACFSAKHAGRGRVALYQPHNGDVARHHSEILLASGVREALENDRCVLYAQPIVATSALTPHAHIEILLRMLDESGELLSPMTFIPAAERYGLMSQLDRWVVRQVLQVKGTMLAAYPGLIVGMNLSANSLDDPRFADFLLQCIEQSPLPPQHICFEVTETAIINHLAQATQLISRLRERGCLIALDDFGSGLSSFAYLKQFPVDVIKIDGAFIKQLPDNPTDRAIVECIHGLATRIDAITVAEYVENDAIRSTVQDIGVHYVQGYGIASPAPLEGCLAWLEAQAVQTLLATESPD